MILIRLVLVFVVFSLYADIVKSEESDLFRNAPASIPRREVILPVCCQYQNQFKEDTSACATNPSNNALTFDDNLNVPSYILSYGYRNRTHQQNIRYGLRKDAPVCPGGSFEMTLDLGDNKDPNDPSYLISLTMDGILQIGLDYYSTKEYCINTIQNQKVTFSVCKPTCDAKRPCIPKCCDKGQIWDFGDSHIPHCGDISGDDYWEPTLYEDRFTKLSREKRSEMTLHYVLHHPGSGYCDFGHPFLISLKNIQDGYNGILFRVLQDGSIATRVRRRQWTSLPKGDYCMDGIKNPFGESKPNINSNSPSIPTENEEPETVILYCHKDIETSDSTISKIYGVSMMISSLFLILTLLVFALLWEKYKANIQRWTIFFYVAALLVMYFFFILSYFSNYFDGESVTNMTMCRFVGIGMHFSFLMSFCFLFCINFEIWWTVRSFTSPSNSFQGFHRLFAYIGFSLGLPLIILCIGLILEAVYDSDLNSDVIIPEYGRFTCNIGSRDAFWAYMYGPVGVLLLCNTAFFLTTVYSMWQILQAAKKDSNITVKQKKQSDLISRFGKLYIIQGVPWIFELVSFAAHEDEYRWYWIMFDLINIFQSIAIFLIFVCNRETVFALKSKYPILNKFLNPLISKSGITREELNDRREEDSGKLSTVEIGTIPVNNIEMK